METTTTTLDDYFVKQIEEYKLKNVHDPTKIVLKKANTVVSIYFKGKGNIDLERLARLNPYVEFSSDKFAAAMIRVQPPSSCGLMFSVRKCVLSGVKTLSQNIIIAQKYAKMLDESSINVEQIEFKIMNEVICMRTGYELDLHRLKNEMKYKIKYEPSTFNCAIMEPGEEHRVKTAMIFGSGSINFVGVTREEDAYNTFVWLEKKLRKFKKIANSNDKNNDNKTKEKVSSAIKGKKSNNKDKDSTESTFTTMNGKNKSKNGVNNVAGQEKKKRGMKSNPGVKDLEKMYTESEEGSTVTASSSSIENALENKDKKRKTKLKKEVLKRKHGDIERDDISSEDVDGGESTDDESNEKIEGVKNKLKTTIGDIEIDAQQISELDSLMRSSNTFNYGQNTFIDELKNSTSQPKRRKIARTGKILKNITII